MTHKQSACCDVKRMSSTDECTICILPFNKSTRKLVECEFCHHVACQSCQKQFLLNQPVDPCCMNCRVPWNNEFIMTRFSRAFMHGELADHRKNILFEQEKALLPQTQERIARIDAEMELHGLKEMQRVYKRLKRNEKIQQLQQEIDVIQEEHGLTTDEASHTTHQKIRKNDIMCGCIREDCRGFVVKSSATCGMCKTKVCKRCLHENTPDHECKQEDVATATLMLENTKPCPSCGVMIHKISGCSQMWCTQCHTTFCWNTLMPVDANTRRHNPHYYEYLRRRGEDVRMDAQVAQQLACEEGLPEVVTFIQRIRRVYGSSRNTFNNISLLYRTVNHVIGVLIPPLNVALDTSYPREQYLRNNISEEEFKRTIWVKTMSNERNRHVANVLQLFIARSSELLRLLFNNDALTLAQMEEQEQELDALIKYCNTELDIIGRNYRFSVNRFKLVNPFIA